MSNFRWVICSLLFFATTVNYLDRQVLSLTYKDFIAPVFGWSDNDYGTITAVFSIIYALCNLFAGKFIDRLGTRKGYLWAIFIWSLGACLHAGCGVGTSALKAVGFVGMMGVTTSVWLFLACRAVLALGEAGNFPAAIKVTAEYFPKKDRAFATSIFNAGSSVGALAAPLSIPLIAKYYGWEVSFIVIGGLGFVWMGFWMWLYRKPGENPRVNAAELEYINQDEGSSEQSSDVRTDSNGKAGSDGSEPASVEKKISYAKAFSLPQTWALVLGRFLTDGVWWFFLFWTPGYLSDQFGYKSSDGMGMALIFTLYAIVTFVSIYLCKIPTYMVDKRGMNAYEGRMVAMFIFACFPLLALGAQPLGAYSAWWPAVLIGLACAGHQAWSANVYSVVGDMFPKSTIGTLTGIAQFAAGCGSFLVNKCAGALFTYAAGTTVVDGREVEMTKDLLASGAQYARPAMEFIGYTGKPAGYLIVFGYCAVAYLVGWCCMKGLVPHYKKVEL
jgi:ACS family hexuronate transporter-like MFS transporter